MRNGIIIGRIIKKDVVTITQKEQNEKLKESENSIILLEFVKNARTLIRQTKLIHGIKLKESDEDVLKSVLAGLKSTITLFRT
jgi:hypothetical protein